MAGATRPSSKSNFKDDDKTLKVTYILELYTCILMNVLAMNYSIFHVPKYVLRVQTLKSFNSPAAKGSNVCSGSLIKALRFLLELYVMHSLLYKTRKFDNSVLSVTTKIDSLSHI